MLTSQYLHFIDRHSGMLQRGMWRLMMMKKMIWISEHLRLVNRGWVFVNAFHMLPVIIVMYRVYMSENLYPARLKQKSHSRAAVSNKQKRLKCPFKPFSGQVGWAQRGRETVPDPGSSDSETPITECTVGASNNEHRSIWRSKLAPTGVRDELTPVIRNYQHPWRSTA